MRINLLQDQSGSDDGLTLRHFKKGDTPEVSEWLGEVFIREGWAQRHVDVIAPTRSKPAKPQRRKAKK